MGPNNSFQIPSTGDLSWKRVAKLIEIHGHTDNSGEKKYNKELSLKRAEAIKDFLMSNGVKNTLTVKGFGDEKPIYPNENKALKGRNRRVEIYLKQNIDG